MNFWSSRIRECKEIKYIVLVVSITSSFLTAFLGSALNVALPSIGKELSIDAVLITWINTSYLLSTTIFLVPFGRLSDIYGRKKIFLYGVYIFTLSSLLCGIANKYNLLIISRISQGIGAGMLFATITALLTSVFPLGERGKALGISVTSTYLGLSLGPFLGGVLTKNFGWRSVFIFSTIIGIITIILVLTTLKEEWVEAKEESFDLLGAMIYGVTLTSFMYGFTRLPSKTGIYSILVGILGFAIFIYDSLRKKDPILDIKIFLNNRTFSLSNISALINYSATSAVSLLLSLYLQQIKGLNPQSAGMTLIFQPLTQALFSPIAGRFSDKIQPGYIASIGMTFTALGLFLLRYIDSHTPITFIIFCSMILGLGFGLFSSPNTNAIMSSVDRKLYGIASSMVSTMRMLGQTFSMGISTIVFTLVIGRVQIQSSNYPLLIVSIKVILTIFTILCFFGIFASLGRGKIIRD
ncbi:MAG: MFS transporter [bacterium]|nr:MFS transporter [bacterium]